MLPGAWNSTSVTGVSSLEPKAPLPPCRQPRVQLLGPRPPWHHPDFLLLAQLAKAFLPPSCRPGRDHGRRPEAARDYHSVSIHTVCCI